MTQGESDALRPAEAIRFSGGQFRRAVEPLDDTCRDRAQGIAWQARQQRCNMI
jgi:hypothetical protein